MDSKNTKNNGVIKVVIVVAILFTSVYGLSIYLANQRLSELDTQTQLLISDQQTILSTIVEITARNGADAVTESIVKDCTLSERNSFDTLLGGLNSGLTRTQLVELERLFGRCGSFYSERKSMVVSRLEREIQIYETYVDQLSLITGSDKSDVYNLQQWRELAVAEKKVSELFSKLVAKQDEIISTLLAGSSPDSEEIQLILREVAEVKDTQAVTNLQVSKLRADLVPY